MIYRRVGESGLLLPAISLGLWHNFGSFDVFENAREMCQTAFDNGITHFDLANNYGPEYGSAETNFGEILRRDFSGNRRDELIISTKAGWDMWPGPYGDFASLKYLTASLDQSLKRMGLEYVDIFYSHRPDPNTPIEETVFALKRAIDQGKALYVGISSYLPEQTERAFDAAKKMGIRLLIHQPNYSIFDRWVESEGLLAKLTDLGMGSIAFTPLAQGMLSTKYINGIPGDSRAARNRFLTKEAITERKIKQIMALNEIAKERNQTLPQMALSWVLTKQNGRTQSGKEIQPVTSALIGASRPAQITENVKAIENLEFSKEELDSIDKIVFGDGAEL